MASNRFSYFGRKPRHQVADSSAATVRLQRAGRSPAEAGEVELIDFARSGARLRIADAAIPGGFDPGEAVVLQLASEKSRLEFELPAVVRWQQAAGPGFWLLGCEFQQEVSLETLGELFLNHILSDGGILAPPVEG